jgi:hypothetical protein
MPPTLIARADEAAATARALSTIAARALVELAAYLLCATKVSRYDPIFAMASCVDITASTVLCHDA